MKSPALPLLLWVALASGIALGVAGLVALLTHHLLQKLHPAPPAPAARSARAAPPHS